MAAFEWPVDKVGIVNSGLSQTGDNLVSAADDGSTEWNVCSPAYERALAFAMEDHSWSQATDVRTLQPAANVPTDTSFDTAFDLPADLVHLIWARVSDRPTEYQLLNRQLILNARGGTPQPTPPNTPQPVTIKAVFSTNSDPVFGTPTLVIALQLFVEAAIYRGLHKDPVNADKQEDKAMAMLQRARTRHDQQTPKRAMFNSRLSASRQVRRPWPLIPPGWGNGRPG